MKRIVILGAGFGGLRAALLLSKKLKPGEAEVILVDRNSYQTYTPALYEVASASRGNALIPAQVDEREFYAQLGGSVAFDVRTILEGTLVTFVRDEVIHMNARSSYVTLREGGEMSFDYALVALGSRTAFFGVEGASEYCATVKSIHDALGLRQQITEAFEATPPGKEMTIAVIGGGLTGFEVITEVALFLSHLKRQVKKEGIRTRLILIEAASTILSAAPSPMRERGSERLAALGVTVMTHAAVSAVGKGIIYFTSGGSLKADVQMWSGGVEGHEVIRTSEGLLLNEAGQIVVNEFLTSKTRHTVLAIGDAAEYLDVAARQKAPATAWAAEQQADVAANNILALLRGENLAVCALKFPGFVAAAGGRYAIAHLFGVTVCGFPAWLLKRAIDLKYLNSLYSPIHALRLWIKNVLLFARND